MGRCLVPAITYTYFISWKREVECRPILLMSSVYTKISLAL